MLALRGLLAHAVHRLVVPLEVHERRERLVARQHLGRRLVALLVVARRARARDGVHAAVRVHLHHERVARLHHLVVGRRLVVPARGHQHAERAVEVLLLHERLEAPHQVVRADLVVALLLRERQVLRAARRCDLERLERREAHAVVRPVRSAVLRPRRVAPAPARAVLERLIASGGGWPRSCVLRSFAISLSSDRPNGCPLSDLPVVLPSAVVVAGRGAPPSRPVPAWISAIVPAFCRAIARESYPTLKTERCVVRRRIPGLTTKTVREKPLDSQRFRGGASALFFRPRWAGDLTRG